MRVSEVLTFLISEQRSERRQAVIWREVLQAEDAAWADVLVPYPVCSSEEWQGGPCGWSGGSDGERGRREGQGAGPAGPGGASGTTWAFTLREVGALDGCGQGGGPDLDSVPLGCS